METIDRRIIIAAAAASLLLVVAGFLIGRATASAVEAGADTTTTTETGDPSVASDTSDTESSDEPAATTTTTTSLPSDGDPTAALPPDPTNPDDIGTYGSDEARSSYVTDLAEAGLAWTSTTDILKAADHICHNLTRLEEMRRKPAFAVRVVWNESMLELSESDLGAWAMIWRTAPVYLCPDTIEYAEDVSYWLGF